MLYQGDGQDISHASRCDHEALGFISWLGIWHEINGRLFFVAWFVSPESATFHGRLGLGICIRCVYNLE